MNEVEHNSRGITNERMHEEQLDSTAQKPVEISSDLADRYSEVARFVASIPEELAIALFTPTKDDPRLVELGQFLSFITRNWGCKAPFYFFPKMRDEVRHLHRHFHRDGKFPEFLFGRPTSDRDVEGGLLPLAFFCDYTSCGRGRRGDFPSLRRQMGKLLLLNALGWDIYGCPNPILFGCRMQRAIPWIVNLVAESDEASLEEQHAAARKMARAVGAVVFSGRRSLHQYYRLVNPIRNPHVVTLAQLDNLSPPTGGGRWNRVVSLKRKGLLGPILVESFREAADLLRGIILERTGLKLCTPILFNFACLSRVPGFVHTGSGDRARLVSINAGASWPIVPLAEPDEVKYSPVWRKWLGISDEEVFPRGHKNLSVLVCAPVKSIEIEERAGKKNESEEEEAPLREDASKQPSNGILGGLLFRCVVAANSLPHGVSRNELVLCIGSLAGQQDHRPVGDNPLGLLSSHILGKKHAIDLGCMGVGLVFSKKLHDGGGRNLLPEIRWIPVPLGQVR